MSQGGLVSMLEITVPKATEPHLPHPEAELSFFVGHQARLSLCFLICSVASLFPWQREEGLPSLGTTLFPWRQEIPLLDPAWLCATLLAKKKRKKGGGRGGGGKNKFSQIFWSSPSIAGMWLTSEVHHAGKNRRREKRTTYSQVEGHSYSRDGAPLDILKDSGWEQILLDKRDLGVPQEWMPTCWSLIYQETRIVVARGYREVGKLGHE